MEKTPYPLKAIRRRCQECMNGQLSEITQCPCKDCPLFKLRSGKRKAGISSLKAIRKKCLDCSENAATVKRCEFDDCPLYPYRLGHNPNKKGIGAGKIPASFQKRTCAVAAARKTQIKTNINEI